MSLTDWDTGNLVLYDLSRGTKQPVTNKGSWKTSGDFAETSIISPDGNSVAYGWYLDLTDRYEVRIAGVHGSDSGRIRTVYADRDVKAVGVEAWTPDGNEVIATVSRGTGGHHIVAIRASVGGARILHTSTLRQLQHAAVSPDGHWVAFDVPAKGRVRDVHVVGVDGRAGNVVARDEGDAVVLGWAARGGELLFASTRNGTRSVWSLTIAAGKAVGPPLLVRSNMWGASRAGVLGDGSVLYWVVTGTLGVFTVPVDPVTGIISPRETLQSGGNQNSGGALGWSSDGEFIAYLDRRAGSADFSDGPADIVVRSVTHGDVQRISPRMSTISELHWFHDGRAVLLRGKDDRERYGIFRMELESASLKLLLHLAGQPDPDNLAFTAAGKRILFTTTAVGGILINELAAARGTVEVLRRIQDGGYPVGLALSPDGRNLAVGVRDIAIPGQSRILIAPIDGGQEREVYRLLPPEELAFPYTRGFLAWTPDGHHLIFSVTSRAKRHGSTELRRLSLDDGTTRTTGFKKVVLGGMTVSPSGRTLMYSAGRSRMELWRMEAPMFGDPRAAAGAHR